MQAETNNAYTHYDKMFLGTSGTVIEPELAEKETSQMTFPRMLKYKAENWPDRDASDQLEIDHIGDGDSAASDDLLPTRTVANEAQDNLQAVVDSARNEELQEVADRLAAIDQEPLGEEDTPLQAVAARGFVEYCVARKKKIRPLMTVTPTGELDVTWKGSKGEGVTMRFFPDQRIWVAYTLLKLKGSLETTTTGLSDPDLPFKIPDWA